MKVFDNYEISPCTRTEEPDSPGKYHFEVCEPDQADVWTLYGHINGEGVQAIGDFPTRESAEEVFSLITGMTFTGSYNADAHLRMQRAAPRMLDALRKSVAFIAAAELAQHEDGYQVWVDCRAAIEAADGTAAPPANITTPHQPIIIEVRGGVVQEVQNVPPGIKYEIVDHDDLDDAGVVEEEATSPLPPDPEGMNDKRSTWAGQAVSIFRKATGTDEADAICDLLADMMHWADRKNYDFVAALLRAWDHYDAETSAILGDIIPALLHTRRQIAHIWGIDDVQFVRPDLSDDNAWKVLLEVEKMLDSESGISWSVVRAVAAELFPSPTIKE